MLKRVKLILIIVGVFSLCVFYTNEGNASFQNYFSFKQISYEQGLPGVSVHHQIQDKDGIMWICIESIGLSKYDGHKFTLYNHQSDNPLSISSNYVNMVVEDENDVLWIATDYGLNRFDKSKQTFQTYLNKENDSLSIPNNNCKYVYIDSKGSLWVGTENGLAVKEKNSQTFKQYLSRKSTSLNVRQISVLNITQQDENTIWLGTNIGLIKFNISSGEYYLWTNDGNNKNAPINNRILNTKLDNKGYLWIATHGGLDRFNLKTERFEHWEYKDDLKFELELEGTNTLLFDQFGKLWVGTYTKGIVVIDIETNDYTRITKENSGDSNIKSNHIKYFYEDNLGLIWIGTKFEGIFKYNDNINVFNTWPKNQESLIPLKNKYILSFYEDKSDYYWLGSKLEGLFKINSKTGEIINYQYKINQPTSISSNRVQCIFRDNQQKLWVGTENGLNLMEEKKGTFLKLNDIPINGICEDHNGVIWIATPIGVYVLDQFQNTVKQYNSNHSFFYNDNIEIMMIYCDSESTIWFSTRYNGLFSYSHENDLLNHYQYIENSNIGISGNMTRAILEDSKNRFWISTKSQGITCLNRKTKEYVKYGMQDGLPSDLILPLEEDLSGNIWMGTHNGIAKFNPETKTIFNYNSDYGLMSNISELGASHIFKTGELLFGGNNGFNVFEPEKIKPNNKTAPLVFSSIKIDDIEISKTDIALNEIVLGYKKKLISFEFTLTDYNAPFRHQYAVMMEGVDKDYRQLGNRNYVSYSNLESGKYTFKIKGANEFGTWTSEPLAISIIVKKPFYKLLLFKIVVVLLILAIIAIIISQTRKRQHTLERLINERTKKLEIAYKELLNKNTKIREQNRQIELHQANLELKVAERTRDLEIAKSKAEESDRLKSSFLANMSHEIRTPLNAITGFSALVGGDIYNPERKQKYVNIIKANTISLLKLVEDILDISRIEAEQLTIEKEQFDFNNMITEMNVIFQEEIKMKRDKNVKLICENKIKNNTKILFYSDQVRIKQILVNLLNNAIKFTNSGEIRFGYKLEKNNILFWVKDTGIGIKKKDLDTIFDRFTKIENENAMYRGTGLGLSISKSLTKMLGGKMWVNSLENIGSSFYFNIPGEIIIQDTVNTKATIKNPAPQKLDLSNKSILIVEYERTNYVLVHSYLMGTNVKMSWANNSKTAIEFCEKDKLDLVIFDFRIHDNESIITFEKIKQINPNIKILAQTSYATDEDKKKLKKLGFNDYIIKPYLKKDLLEKINQLIGDTSIR